MIMMTDKFSPGTRFRAACLVVILRGVCLFCFICLFTKDRRFTFFMAIDYIRRQFFGRSKFKNMLTTSFAKRILKFLFPTFLNDF